MIITSKHISLFPFESERIIRNKDIQISVKDIKIQLVKDVIKSTYATQSQINRLVVRTELLNIIERCKKKLILQGFDPVDVYTKTVDSLLLIDDWYTNIYIPTLPYNGIPDIQLSIPCSQEDAFEDEIDLVLIDGNHQTHLIEIIDEKEYKTYQKTSLYTNTRLWALYQLSGVIPASYNKLIIKSDYVSISKIRIDRKKVFQSFKGVEYLLYGITQRVTF